MIGRYSAQHPVWDLSKTDKSIRRGPDTQRESPKVRVIAGHIKQAERGAIRKSPQAHKHFRPLLPTTTVFVSYRFVLVRVQVQARATSSASRGHGPKQALATPGAGSEGGSSRFQSALAQSISSNKFNRPRPEMFVRRLIVGRAP
jgi:hypothetical protein